jgi:hypothetical protein
MNSPWTIDGARALLTRDGCSAVVDYARPADGLTHLRWSGQGLEHWCVLGVDAPPDVETSLSLQSEACDWYCRGLDLVATYREAATPPLRLQTYWRVADDAPAGAVAIDLQVSVQTSRLDADPHRKATTCVPPVEVRHAVAGPSAGFFSIDPTATDKSATKQEPGCWLFRPVGADYSYAQFVHPLDYGDDRLLRETINGREQFRLVHRLFTGDLEKGVILRARVRGVLLPRQRDEALALESYAALLAAQLPLTT